MPSPNAAVPPQVRLIRPEFWTDERLARASTDARLLFVAMWNYADDKGRAYGAAEYWRAKVWPVPVRRTFLIGGQPKSRDVVVSAMEVEIHLAELVDAQRVVRYSVGGEAYLCVPRLVIHQEMADPRPSVLPPPPREALVALGLPDAYVSELLDPRPWRKHKPPKAEDTAVLPGIEAALPQPQMARGKAELAKREAVGRIFVAWREVMGKTTRATLDGARARVIENALKLKTEREIIMAIKGCALSAWNMGDNPGGKLYNGLDLICRDAEHLERFINEYLDHKRRAADVSDPVLAAMVRTERAKAGGNVQG